MQTITVTKPLLACSRLNEKEIRTSTLIKIKTLFSTYEVSIRHFATMIVGLQITIATYIYVSLFLHLPGEVTGEICGYKPYPQYRPADVVPMTTNVIDDLALLPNLKSISLPKDKPFEILDIRQTGLVKHLDGTYLGAGQGIQIDKLIVPRVFLEALNEKGIALYHGSKKLDIAAILNGESA